MKSLASTLAVLPVLLVAATASSPLGEEARTLIITYSDGHVQTVALDRDAAMIETLRFGEARVSGVVSPNLTGTWQITVVLPTGQPAAGTYTTTVTLEDRGGQLFGSGVWSHGERSRYTGWVRDGRVHLDRVDEGGFRGAFEGTLSADGRVIHGSGQNDPSSPGGNAASYTWTARRS